MDISAHGAPPAKSRNSRRFSRCRVSVSLVFARAVGDARARPSSRVRFSAMVSPLVECPADCGWRWTQTWFGDCACGVRDRLSFALGLASILAWGSAELPQIYANFRNGRSEGISLAFIVTWLTGDALNLLGCAVSPTLPTQLYTALVYTATTVVLIAQHVHYNSVHYNARRRHRRLKNILDDDRDDLEALLPTGSHGSGGEALTGSSWSDEDDDATTTRTRRASFTPSVASVASGAAASVQGGRAIGRGRDGDGDGAGGASSTGARTAPSSARTFLAGSWQASSSSTRAFSPPARRDARASHGGRWSGGGGGRWIGGGALPENRRGGARLSASLAAAGALSLVGVLGRSDSDFSALASSSRRGLLSGGSSEGYRHAPLVPAPSWVGASLGWAMTCVYLSGRVPQILMNRHRGSVEGLSVSMFTLAAVGNATYMASILARSTAWSRVKPNLPWLVDAGACLLMDAVILGQHAAYRRAETDRDSEDWEREREEEEEREEEQEEDVRSRGARDERRQESERR